jgi:hypothetical protein
MSGQRKGEEWAQQERLSALAAFLPICTDPSFKFGEWHQGGEDSRGYLVMGWFEPGVEASRFLEMLYESGWVRDFDWGSGPGRKKRKTSA